MIHFLTIYCNYWYILIENIHANLLQNCIVNVCIVYMNFLSVDNVNYYIITLLHQLIEYLTRKLQYITILYQIIFYDLISKYKSDFSMLLRNERFRTYRKIINRNNFFSPLLYQKITK